MWLVCLGLLAMAWWRALRTRKPDAKPPETPGQSKEHHPVAAASLLGAGYAVFATWMFFAWYSHHKPLSKYKFGGDGWLGSTTYAGGADKFGHAWSTMVLARIGTVFLHDWGGIARRKASLVSAGLSQLLFTGVEVRDGTYYEFSFSDLTGDAIGAVMAVLLDNFPKLAELFAFRVEYFPSPMYLRKLAGTSPCPYGGCSRWNFAEDYSGETYLAAFHLAGIPAIRNKKPPTWTRFVDATAGFRARDYRPLSDPDMDRRPQQDVFLGLTFNAQGFFDWLLEDRAPKAGKVTHGLFEVVNLPFTTLPVTTWSRLHAAKPPKL